MTLAQLRAVSSELREKRTDFDFEKLTAYQRAVDFSNDMFTLTKTFAARDGFALSDQLRRAALSIALNIAEGSGRSKREFRNFLRIARSSCYECIPLIEIAARQGFLQRQLQQHYYKDCGEISRMISGLFNAIGRG